MPAKGTKKTKVEALNPTLLQGLEAAGVFDADGEVAQTDPIKSKLQELLVTVLAKQNEALDREREEEEAAKAFVRKQREEHARARDNERKQHELAQALCGHRKEYGPVSRTQVVCQRDHRHNQIFLCQRCQKIWFGGVDSFGERIPSDLVPPLEWIGGPTV